MNKIEFLYALREQFKRAHVDDVNEIIAICCLGGTIAFLCAHTFLYIQVIKHYILTLLGKVKPVRQG